MPRASTTTGAWGSVGRTALAKVLVMGVTGAFGLVNTRLIISHFGTVRYLPSPSP